MAEQIKIQEFKADPAPITDQVNKLGTQQEAPKQAQETRPIDNRAPEDQLKELNEQFRQVREQAEARRISEEQAYRNGFDLQTEELEVVYQQYCRVAEHLDRYSHQIGIRNPNWVRPIQRWVMINGNDGRLRLPPVETTIDAINNRLHDGQIHTASDIICYVQAVLPGTTEAEIRMNLSIFSKNGIIERVNHGQYRMV